MYHIYALIDPRDMQVRYVGMSKDAYRRYALHLIHREKSNPEKDAWIQDLRRTTTSPSLTILEVVGTREEAYQRETYWIQHYLTLNVPLLNKGQTGKPIRKGIRRKIPKLAIEEVPIEAIATVEQVADSLRMHVETVKRLLREKKIPGFKVAGQWRISPSELRTHLEEQRKRSSKEE